MDTESLLRRNNEHLIKANRTLTWMTLGLSVLVFVSLSFSFQIWKYQPAPKLLGLTTDNRVLPLPFLNEPFETQGTALRWLNDNIPKLYTVTYADIGNHPTNISSLFLNQEVMDSFLTLIKVSGFERLVIDEKRLCTSRTYIQTPARILSEGEVGSGSDKRYAYRAQVPIGGVCQNEKNGAAFNRIVDVTIVRESPTKAPGELVIVSINSFQGTAR